MNMVSWVNAFFIEEDGVTWLQLVVQLKDGREIVLKGTEQECQRLADRLQEILRLKEVG